MERNRPLRRSRQHLLRLGGLSCPQPLRGLGAPQEPAGDSACFITCLWFGRDHSKPGCPGEQSQAGEERGGVGETANGTD